MSNISRRQFVKGAARSAPPPRSPFPRVIRAQGLNEKLQVGFIAGRWPGRGPIPVPPMGPRLSVRRLRRGR